MQVFSAEPKTQHVLKKCKCPLMYRSGYNVGWINMSKVFCNDKEKVLPIPQIKLVDGKKS